MVVCWGLWGHKTPWTFPFPELVLVYEGVFVLSSSPPPVEGSEADWFNVCQSFKPNS